MKNNTLDLPPGLSTGEILARVYSSGQVDDLITNSSIVIAPGFVSGSPVVIARQGDQSLSGGDLPPAFDPFLSTFNW